MAIPLGDNRRAMGKKAETKPPPKCKAILLCDQVLIDARTGKISIIGVFEEFVIRRRPGAIAPCNAFLQLTDGIGKYGITVEAHDLREDKIVARTEVTEIEFQERASIQNLIIKLPILIEHDGSYDFVVFADGQEIDRQRFKAFWRDGNATN
jgi:hypothetical protein